MPLSLTGLLGRYRRDERGVISVMAVGALFLVLAVAMVVIDTGSMLYARRDLQAATDAAALGAVRQIGNAENAARSILDLNGYSPGDAPQVVTGIYSADPSLAPRDRFVEADGATEASQINAVRVIKYAEAPTYFASLFGFENLTRINAVSTAAYTKTVSFSAGTRVAELNSGLANQLLGGLLGTTLNLSLVDYNGLANANIDALMFLDALATQVGLEAGSDTYGDLLSGNATVADLVRAAVDVLNSETFDGNPAVARGALEAALNPAGNISVPLNDILNATPFLNRTIGSVASGASEGQSFNLLDLVSGTAMVLGQGNAVNFNVAGGVPPLASVSGSVTVGEPMARMAVGTVGDFVRTSQVTIQLDAYIDTGITLLADARVRVPIHISMAEGTATVSNIPCTEAGTMTALEGMTGTLAARYGTMANSTPTIATIRLNVPLLGNVNVIDLTASGSYPVGSSTQVVNFTQIDVENQSVRTVSADTAVFSGLAGALQIGQVVLLGGIPVPGLAGLLTTILSAVGNGLAVLDPIISSLLTTLGIKLGVMDMTVHGVRCNSPTLVL
ncbi:pilus assembly protein TadG-related protein [Parvibaculum lavamentivorans]|nr:pilus assembly protein TadG-related protein [Parvibaculum lavamentivorans]